MPGTAQPWPETAEPWAQPVPPAPPPGLPPGWGWYDEQGRFFEPGAVGAGGIGGTGFIAPPGGVYASIEQAGLGDLTGPELGFPKVRDPRNAKIVPRWGLGDIAYGLLIWLGATFVAVGAAVAVLGMASGAISGETVARNPWLTVAGGLASAVGFLGWPFLASHLRGYGTLRLDFGLKFHWYDVLLGLAGALVALFLETVVSAIAHALHSEPDSNTRILSDATQNPTALFFVVAFACVVAPVVEETFFRGLMFGAIEKRSNRWVAFPVTTLVFAALHAQGSDSALGLVFMLLAISMIGLVLTGLRLITRRLGPGIVAHMAVNTLATILTLTAGSGG